MENENFNGEVMDGIAEATTGTGTGLKVIGGIAALGALAFGAIKFCKHRKAKKEKEEAKVDVYNDSEECEDE